VAIGLARVVAVLERPAVNRLMQIRVGLVVLAIRRLLAGLPPTTAAAAEVAAIQPPATLVVREV
jgi:hypothetical protein